jgi:hypothetical protein
MAAEMMRVPYSALTLLLPLAAVAVLPGADPAAIRGVVRDEHVPVAGARVRLQGTTQNVLTDQAGRFSLSGAPAAAARVTAWKEGYLIGAATADTRPLQISLRRLPTDDNESYAWVDPTPNPRNNQNCGNCHETIYREWSASGHARSATGRHFQNLYAGTDWHGRAGVGWSLLADHPDGAGVCTSCHAPTVEPGDPAAFDLRQVRGVAAQGVHCDYCHKIAGTAQTPVGLTHGRFGLNLLRPKHGQLFFGPLDDVDRGEDTRAAVYQESRYCAACHEGTVFGVAVYSTYSEWLASPARRQGKECQSCHMTPTGTLMNIAPGKGGVPRDPVTLGNHHFFAGSQEEMLRQAVRVHVDVSADRREVRAVVTAQADQVGHALPTGFVDRNLVLVVEAFDAAGRTLMPTGGPLVAGKAGRLYAKQLRDFDGHAPVPFWRARPEVEDTRLRPGGTDRAAWRFATQVTRAHVRLLYRRFWPSVVEAKHWPDRDTVVADNLVTRGLP